MLSNQLRDLSADHRADSTSTSGQPSQCGGISPQAVGHNIDMCSDHSMTHGTGMP